MFAHGLGEALKVFGHRLMQIYGQGESPMTITYLGKEKHSNLTSQCFDGGYRRLSLAAGGPVKGSNHYLKLWKQGALRIRKLRKQSCKKG